MARARKITFRTSLVLLLTLLITASSGLVLVVSYLSSRDSVQALSSSLLASHANRVTERSMQYLEPASEAAELTRGLVAAELLDPHRPEALAAYFHKILRAQSQVVSVYFGAPSGEFTMVKRMADDTLSVKRVVPGPESAVTTWTHEQAGWGEAFPLHVKEPLDVAYDPRKRPWYTAAEKGAGEVVWTDVYLFFTDKSPGITCAVRLSDAAGQPLGVLGIDIQLAQLSFFLGRMNVSKHGQAFIVDEKGALVGVPVRSSEDLSQLVAQEGLVSIEAASDPRIAASAASWDGESGELYAFEHEGEGYLGMIRQFPRDSPWPWRIGVFVPEDDFLGAVKRNNIITFCLSLFLILVAIVSGVLLSRTISRPLTVLSHEMELVRNFDLESSGTIDSNIDEVAQMSKNFGRMKQGLLSFQKYVPRVLVRELIRLGEEAELGGRKQELTVFFSDIEGFTSIAEAIPPEELVSSLAEYFTEMTAAIEGTHGGTIDKFIGDAVMAFWGAPAPDEHHALHACRAALDAQKRLGAMMERRARAGLPTFRVRMGINSGEVIVGNVGSRERLSYTALGDTVNIAARLESLNKHYDTTLMVGADTLEHVASRFEVRELDRVAVKGRKQSLAVYELLSEVGELDEATAAWRDRFAKAVKLYRERAFADALAVFTVCLNHRPEDRATHLYMERCERYIAEPPGEDWKGVYKAKRK